MSQRKHRLLRVLFVVAALPVVLVVLAQILLNSPLAERLVLRYASEYVDARVKFSDIRVSLFREFPSVRLTLDSLSVTYPHDRFAVYDGRGVYSRMLDAGRGEIEDTLVRAERITAAVNVRECIRGRLTLNDASVSALGLYAHQYDTTANWNIFKAPADTVEASSDSSGVSDLPWISIGSVLFSDRPRVVYSARFDTVAAVVSLAEMELHGDVKLNLKSSDIGIDSLVLRIDSLRAFAALPSDSLAVRLPFLRVEADGKNRIRLETGAHVFVCAGSFGRAVADIGLNASSEFGTSTSGNIALPLKPDLEASLSLHTSGADLALNGKVDDALGADPAFRLRADGNVYVDSLKPFLPSGFLASGDLSLSLKANARKSDIGAYRFDRAAIEGLVKSGKLEFRMPEDTLSAKVDNTALSFSSGRNGIDIRLGLDSLMLKQGMGMRARIRGMQNEATLTMVTVRDRKVPKLSVETSGSSAFFRMGRNRFALKDLGFSASMRKRSAPRHRRPRVSYRDTLNHDFDSKDIDFRVDSTISRYLKAWNPSGEISIGRAFVSSPSLPLRTRLSAFSGAYEHNILTLDTLALTCGTSDVSVTGQVKGIMRSLLGRGGISADLEVDAGRINANEIIVAMEKASRMHIVDNPEAETDDSFIIDSIADARVDSSMMALVVLPGNVEANIGIEADRVDFSDLQIRPMKAYVRLQDRTLQVMNSSLTSNLGAISLDAFYSTRSRSDISAGVDIHLSDVSAEGIIHMIPTVDDMMPALKSFNGKLDCRVSATTQLDTNMNVVIPSLDGMIRISGEDLSIKDLGEFRKVARLLMFKDRKTVRIQDMTVSGVIHDSRLEVFPFELGVDRYRLAMDGTQCYDGTMNYHISVLRSPLLIPFGINLKGTMDKWHMGVGLPKYRYGKVPAYTAELDTVYINIAGSIRDIFRKGKLEALRHGSLTGDIVSRRARDNDALSAVDVTSSEYKQVDSMLIDNLLSEMNESVEQEAETSVSEALKDFDTLMEEYGMMTNDQKRAERKSSRNRKQNERH